MRNPQVNDFYTHQNGKPLRSYLFNLTESHLLGMVLIARSLCQWASSAKNSLMQGGLNHGY